MGPVKKTVVEALILVVVGGAIASAANGLRSERSLLWSKNYFRKVVIPKAVDSQVDGSDLVDNVASQDGGGHVGGIVKTKGIGKPVAVDSTNVAKPAQSRKPNQAKETNKLDHPFQEASFDQVLAAYNDPDRASGLIVIVDARADEPYEEGHIPGAVQIDHYQLERYLDDAMQFIGPADKVFVYCNGGACEDSIFVCQDLFEAGIDLDRIFLYAGGWAQWSTTDDAPIETGPRRY